MVRREIKIETNSHMVCTKPSRTLKNSPRSTKCFFQHETYIRRKQKQCFLHEYSIIAQTQNRIIHCKYSDEFYTRVFISFSFSWSSISMHYDACFLAHWRFNCTTGMVSPTFAKFPHPTQVHCVCRPCLDGKGKQCLLHWQIALSG